MINRKKTLILLVATTGLLLGSCSSDDSSTDGANTGLAAVQNAAEEIPVPLTTIESGIDIDGALKIKEAAPTPNSSLEFKLESIQQEAFQKSGLDINFSADGDIAGAYIQFKDVDGNASDSYFDIPASAFGSEGGRGRKQLDLKKQLRLGKEISQDIDGLDDSGSTINLDFDGVPAGKFCYDICLYDEAGQIYIVQEVCVTVEAWGGNNSIVGEWILDREEIVGEEEEEKASITCEDGTSFEADYEITETVNKVEFVLNEDGSYYEVYDFKYRGINFMESKSKCEAIYGEAVSQNEKYSGNWAFNEEENTLTVVDFKVEDFNDALENEEYKYGELYLEGVNVEVVNDELVITDDEGKLFFKRK